jgi:hypothetical protein
VEFGGLFCRLLPLEPAPRATKVPKVTHFGMRSSEAKEFVGNCLYERWPVLNAQCNGVQLVDLQQ